MRWMLAWSALNGACAVWSTFPGGPSHIMGLINAFMCGACLSAWAFRR